MFSLRWFTRSLLGTPKGNKPVGGKKCRETFENQLIFHFVSFAPGIGNLSIKDCSFSGEKNSKHIRGFFPTFTMSTPVLFTWKLPLWDRQKFNLLWNWLSLFFLSIAGVSWWSLNSLMYQTGWVERLHREFYFKTNFLTRLHSLCSSYERSTGSIRWPLTEETPALYSSFMFRCTHLTNSSFFYNTRKQIKAV